MITIKVWVASVTLVAVYVLGWILGALWGDARRRRKDIEYIHEAFSEIREEYFHGLCMMLGIDGEEDGSDEEEKEGSGERED